MKTCETCKKWIDCTAECAEHLNIIANGGDVPASIENALENDSNEKNDCGFYN